MSEQESPTVAWHLGARGIFKDVSKTCPISTAQNLLRQWLN